MGRRSCDACLDVFPGILLSFRPTRVNQKSLGRAGSKCWLGKCPVVRGVVMNPVDHPHGGGEGRAPIGRKKPATPALGRHC
ncbi:hypothetical protein PVK06_014004 [Gossypium arboreum]|uniref:Large ribosomal subunit protein uL2 C-terminal domain-containing protein n=1 Tax=Gossypium arboreum TaxID=29729 RepID=A0ABR0PTD5_GOSAR|nr:hypothetical protein PVK06_014004 [Gossypium arboreum]